jgi:hypothetical protein
MKVSVRRGGLRIAARIAVRLRALMVSPCAWAVPMPSHAVQRVWLMGRIPIASNAFDRWDASHYSQATMGQCRRSFLRLSRTLGIMVVICRARSRVGRDYRLCDGEAQVSEGMRGAHRGFEPSTCCSRNSRSTALPLSSSARQHCFTLAPIHNCRNIPGRCSLSCLLPAVGPVIAVAGYQRRNSRQQSRRNPLPFALRGCDDPD